VGQSWQRTTDHLIKRTVSYPRCLNNKRDYFRFWLYCHLHAAVDTSAKPASLALWLLLASHFRAVHSLNSCLHPTGSRFSFEPSVILYNPEGIIHKLLTSQYGETDIRLFRPPHNKRKQVLEKTGERNRRT
jgi:hypothetical protein